MYSAITGLSANSEAMSVISNNISNVNTVGFKSSRALFSDMLSSTIGNDSQIGSGALIQQVDNVFSQGSFETTGQVTDLAIQGDTFFSLGAPSATGAQSVNSMYFTRAGAFHVDGNNYLVNPDGYRVLDEALKPVVFDTTNAPAGFTKIVSIDDVGTITYLDNTGAQQSYGTRIGVATIPDESRMVKVGGTLFQAGAVTGITATSIAAANGNDEKVLSNNLEQSNVDMATQFVKMILTQRAYSACSKAITAADEMSQEVINIKR